VAERGRRRRLVRSAAAWRERGRLGEGEEGSCTMMTPRVRRRRESHFWGVSGRCRRRTLKRAVVRIWGC
jgi:hypothetical protein